MKKIAMFTMGTRGDVQPYIYLSRALKAKGYDVTLGSHPCWRGLIEDAGVHFESIGPDIDIEMEAAVIRGKSPNAAMSMIRTMNFIMKIIQGATREVYKLCEGRDLIIVTHSKIGAVEAAVLGIPVIDVTLQTEMIPEKLKEQKFTDKLIGSMIGHQIDKPYNRIRKEYGLKPMKNGDEIRSDKLNLIPVSKYVIERSPYWEDMNVLTGYWFEEEGDYTPSNELLSFLEAGEKPVIIALGAMSFEAQSERDKLDMFVNALSKTGHRAIIQGFQKTLSGYSLPDTMTACGSVPHSWLFRQGKFVIHHCGFGTSAASMICGIPSLPVPHVLDQLGFAVLLEKAGVATAHISAKDLTGEKLALAIESMDSSYGALKARALELSSLIAGEHGLDTAVRLIEEAMGWA